MSKRIYLVRSGNRGEDVQLVKATSQSSAIRHVTKGYAAEVIDQDTLVKLVQGGSKIEEGN